MDVNYSYLNPQTAVGRGKRRETYTFKQGYLRLSEDRQVLDASELVVSRERSGRSYMVAFSMGSIICHHQLVRLLATATATTCRTTGSADSC